MKIRYNDPVILTVTLLATLVLIIDQVVGNFTAALFVLPGRFDPGIAFNYIRLFTYVLGHRDWLHLISNFAFILLIGPILEEKYRSATLLLMIVVTVLITGILNIVLFNTGLMGASGVVFMLILLSSFTNYRSGEIPLTFILIVVLYLAKEIVQAFTQDDISQFAHIIGGMRGSLKGFLLTRSIRA